MKKITFVCQYLAKGGAERVMSVLINYFADKGYEVRVILLYEELISYKINDSVEIVSLNWGKIRGVQKRILCIKELRKLIDNDIVISFLYSAIRDTVFATMFKKKYLIVSERNDPRNDPPGFLRKMIRTFSYLFADIIVFQTKEAQLYFPQLIRNKSIIIENPIKSDLLHKNDTIREKRIVSVCRLTKQKNIKMSIDAFQQFLKKYPDYIFEIYGEGELREDIEMYIKDKKLENKVILKGFSEHVHEEIINAMMYISSSDFEGISNSMLECMAIGLPVICTDCPIGGARKIISNQKNGILIPTNDYVALYEAMCSVAGDKSYRDNLSKNAEIVRDTYSVDNICSKWESIVERKNYKRS